MKKLIVTAAVLLASASLFVSCDKHNDDDNNTLTVCPPADDGEKALADNVAAFAYPLFANVCSASKSTKNVMVSPLSLGEVLMMLANGAEGTTRDQIMKFLSANGQSRDDMNHMFCNTNHYLTNPDHHADVGISNSVWIDNGLEVKLDYRNALIQWLSAETRQQELSTEETMKDVNYWCSSKTHGMIPKIIDEPFSDDVRMALINALHFQGAWGCNFDKKGYS